MLTLLNQMGYPTRPHSAVGSKSDCRSRDLEFDTGLVPVALVEIDHEIILRSFSSVCWLSVTKESMCTKYWLTAIVKLAHEKV